MAKKKQKKTQGGGQQFLTPERYLKERARTLEIGTCYVTKDIDEMKLGHVIVTRRHTGGRISMAGYLVDMACLGVKDSFYKMRMEDWELDEFLDYRRDMFRECSYEEAHNRVWGSIAYAEEAGIKPDKSFLLTQYMLEEDTDDVPLIEYEYGKDGKHFLVCHSELEASRYLPLMRQNLGEGNYNYLIGIGAPGFDEDDEEHYDDFTTSWGLPIDHLDTADIVNAKPLASEKLMLLMGMPLPAGDDEAEKKRQYTDYILSHPEALLRCLPKRELDMLLYIQANRSEAKGVTTIDDKGKLMMELAGVADMYWDFEDKDHVRVADDFLRAALPLAAGVRMSEEAQRRYDVETLVGGMANLYGAVSMADVLQRLIKTRGMRLKEAERLVEEAMEHSLMLNCMVQKVKKQTKLLVTFTTEEIFFFSNYAWDERHQLLNIITRPVPSTTAADDSAAGAQPGQLQHRVFTDQEVEDAGKGEPFVIPNARQKEMWHFLTRELGWDDYYAWRICFELWYTANREQHPNHSKELEPKEYFENEALSLNDLTPAEREKGLRLLAEYMDHMPRWTLKGHAPAEL